MLVALPVPNQHHQERVPELLLLGRRERYAYQANPRPAWAFTDAELTRLTDVRMNHGASEGEIRSHLAKLREGYFDDQIGLQGPLRGGNSMILLGLPNRHGVLARYCLRGMPTNDPSQVVALLDQQSTLN